MSKRKFAAGAECVSAPTEMASTKVNVETEHLPTCYWFFGTHGTQP